MAAGATGAEILLRCAIDHGIDVVFANPGTSEMHFVSAMDTVWGMRGILGLHETVCTGAADGYGRMARKPALTLLHLGPGLANGLCNLHNARRASTPIINLVGDMATWHKHADALLNMDINAIASTVSKSVIDCKSGTDLYAAMESAAALTKQADTVSGSRVVTLVVPHDLSWQRIPGSPRKPRLSLPTSSPTMVSNPVTSNGVKAGHTTAPQLSESATLFIKDCASALKKCPRGKAAMYIGGRAGLRDGDALRNVGRIAAATSAVVYCENAFARLDRGAGSPDLQRLPYFPQDAVNTLKQYEILIVIDVRRPVANFGYEGGPSQLVPLDDENVWELDETNTDVPLALELLSREVKGDVITPFFNCRGVFCSPQIPSIPSGRLNTTALCQIIAALQPEHAIVVDESLTSGNSYWELSKGCPTFSHMTLTGGAIGCGPPLSVGAAVACPQRTVISFQADGSGMYSVQALWTQARENLKVVTIICANRTYAILKVEMAKQRITPSNGRAAKALTEIGEPAIDWVSVARGFGVPATRAKTSEEFAEHLRSAFERQGPSLIEAVL